MSGLPSSKCSTMRGGIESLLQLSESLDPLLGLSTSLITEGGAEGDKHSSSAPYRVYWSTQYAVRSWVDLNSRRASEDIEYSVIV